MRTMAPVKNEEIKIPKVMLLVSIAIMVAFIAFVVLHFTDVEKFVVLLSHAEPKWLFLAVLLQIGTYLCAGLIWHLVIKTAQHKIPLKALARLSVEKLSIDQLIPMGGMSGNLMVVQTMRGFNLPGWLAVEAMLVDILAHYIAYAVVTILALLILWFYHDLTDLIRYLAGIFTIMVIIIPLTILWLLTHKNSQLPAWLLQFKPIRNITQTIKSVSPERVLLPKLLGMTSFLCVAIFFLDAGTLWTMLRITNYSVGILTALVAIIIASIAGSVSFLPGGIGSFEAGSVMTLVLFRVPIEIALTGTLLFRGFALWIPLLPGLLMARSDMKKKP